MKIYEKKLSVMSVVIREQQTWRALCHDALNERITSKNRKVIHKLPKKNATTDKVRVPISLLSNICKGINTSIADVD